MNASIPTFIRNPKIEWSGDLCSLSPFSLSASLRTSFVCVSVCVWTRTSQVINSNWLLFICIFLTVWCRTGLTNLTKVKGKGEKMPKVGRKEKEKKEKKHTNSIARIRARASPPAVSFACVKLHNAVKKKKSKICSISEYYVTINHASHRRTLLTRFQMQIKGKKWR